MHCLRCGKEIADSATFCESCEKAVSEPLVESAYLSKQILLPSRKPQQPRQAQTKTARKTERKPEEEPPRRRGAIVFLAVVCMLLLAAGLYGATRYLNLRSEAAALTEQVSALEEKKAGLERTAAGLNDTVADLEESVADLEEQVSALETAVAGLEKTKAGMEKTLDYVDSRAAFISRDGSPYYHTADCAGLLKDNCYVIDVAAAKERGFSPCPDCRPGE